MNFYVGKAGCALVLDALRMYLRYAENDAHYTEMFCFAGENDFEYTLRCNAANEKVKNTEKMILMYEAALKNFTEEEIRDGLLWIAK